MPDFLSALGANTPPGGILADVLLSRPPVR
jgi:hypothetical protein